MWKWKIQSVAGHMAHRRPSESRSHGIFCELLKDVVFFPFPGLLGSGKTFRKSLRKSQPFEEKCDVDAGDGSLRMETAMFIRDNTDTKG